MDAKKEIPDAKIVSLTVGAADDGGIDEEIVGNDSPNADGEPLIEGKTASKKKRKFTLTIEFCVAVILALTALGTAWASWMSELHESIQAESYALTSALYSEGTSMTNAATIDLSNELSVWNTLVMLESERRAYVEDGDTKNAQRTEERIDYIIAILISDDKEAQEIRQTLRSNTIPDAYDESMIEEYYSEANKTLAKGKEAFERGNAANLYSDSYGLVRVLYSVVMFLLAAIGVYKEPLPRKIMLGMGIVIFLFATGYMCSLPLPEGFSFGTFFAATFGK